MDLTSRQRQHLKSLAHHLKPLIQVGKDGLSDPLRRQIDEALDRHELIKVKLGESSPLDRDAASAALPGSVGAFLVQNIGRVYVLYRPHPDKPRIELPWPTQPEEDETIDQDDPRAPKARAGGSLLGSVRERGASSSGLVPPPRPVFAKAPRPANEPEKVAVPEGPAANRPRREGPKRAAPTSRKPQSKRKMRGPSVPRRGAGRKR